MPLSTQNEQKKSSRHTASRVHEDVAALCRRTTVPSALLNRISIGAAKVLVWRPLFIYLYSLIACLP